LAVLLLLLLLLLLLTGWHQLTSLKSAAIHHSL